MREKHRNAVNIKQSKKYGTLFLDICYNRFWRVFFTSTPFQEIDVGNCPGIKALEPYHLQNRAT